MPLPPTPPEALARSCAAASKSRAFSDTEFALWIFGVGVATSRSPPPPPPDSLRGHLMWLNGWTRPLRSAAWRGLVVDPSRAAWAKASDVYAPRARSGLRAARRKARESVWQKRVQPRLEKRWRAAKPRLVRLADRLQPRLEYYMRAVILPRLDNEAIVGLVAAASSELVNRELEKNLQALPAPVAAEAKVLGDRTLGNLEEKMTALAENEWDVASLISSELETLGRSGVLVDADTEAAVRRIIELQINQAIASLTSGAQLTMISQLNETIQGITDSATAVVGG